MLRFALLGAGFWSQFQLAAWRELDGVECVAVCDRTREKAEALARRFGVKAVSDQAEELFRKEHLDFVDIVTAPEAHAQLVHLAAASKVAVICQKPMAPALETAQQMVSACSKAGVPFFIHENWRWQTPIRQLRRTLRDNLIGAPVRARLRWTTGFDVFGNQPALKKSERLLLADLGVHILDTVRFLFGEVESIYCHTRTVQPDVRGEDMVTLMMKTVGHVSVVCEMAYARIPSEHECFPETLIFAEGEEGTIELGPHYWIRVATRAGVQAKRYPPPRYPWADPAYEVVHASIVPCNAHLLSALQDDAIAETSAADNLKTLELVFAAYDSARTDQVIRS